MRNKILTKLFNAFESITHGTSTIFLPDGSERMFCGPNQGPHAEFILKDWRALELVAAKSDIGLAESYMMDYWTTPDLKAFMTSLHLNMDHFKRDFYGQGLYRFFYALQHLLRRNSKQGSLKNISEHYDLGNDFYSLWLDPSMTYSSALFNADENMEQAQLQKYQRILARMGDGCEDILEIGCGWGGFLEQAARKGAHIKGITLSHEQAKYARKRLDKAGYNQLAQIKLEDYRDVSGQFSGIVSIEMFEAVGEKYWSRYFEQLSRNLAPKGNAIIQTISISEHLFDYYRTHTDFVQKYIFPGGMLPTKTVMRKLGQAHGLEVDDCYDFGLSYARTLEIWLANFDAAKEEILMLGYSESFIRKWRLYLASCYAGFLTKRLDVSQFHFVKA